MQTVSIVLSPEGPDGGLSRSDAGQADTLIRDSAVYIVGYTSRSG